MWLVVFLVGCYFVLDCVWILPGCLDLRACLVTWNCGLVGCCLPLDFVLDLCWWLFVA